MIFCIEHRLECDHDCAGLKQQQEQKKSDQNLEAKQAIIDKIKDRADAGKKQLTAGTTEK